MTVQKKILERHLNVSFQFITIKVEVSTHENDASDGNGIDSIKGSGVPKCCPIFENDCFLLSVMKMWVTQCIFLHSSTFYHVNLGKSQFSCLDMRFTKLGTKFVKKIFELDVDIFHQKQPNCKLDSYERATKKENSTISSWDWGRYRSEEMSPNTKGVQKTYQEPWNQRSKMGTKLEDS